MKVRNHECFPVEPIRPKHLPVLTSRQGIHDGPKFDQEPTHDESKRGDSFQESVVANDELSLEEEFSEGQRHEEELLAQSGLWENDWAEELLGQVFAELVPHMGRSEIDYEFMALDSDTPFASSCPNGSIFFSKALLQNLPSSEVLFFAAHELAHTELRHYATRKRRLSDLRLLIPAPLGSSTRQRLEQAAVLAVRHQEEFEADHQAAQWLGNSLAAMALENLHSLSLKVAPEALSRPTHPPFQKRVDQAQAGIAFPPLLEYLYTLLSG